ncbi:hypothetical protein OS493_031612 [Desmophyllum pertusum]|uniref:ANK_REP_REGION domain-containing protein n=1 Tax=Desmophyllum pertusum TaxID=174260 RepID=A0A9W9YJJ3_9CNID|nr:hypothetical protein OS493_031612 [Desmophyllum pertusum]
MMIANDCCLKSPDNLQILSFYKLLSPDGPSGISVLQALVMEGDAHTVKTILKFSPSNLDISIALITTGTADFLSSRMRTSARHQPSCNAFSPQMVPKNENDSNIPAIMHILHKMVEKFHNASLLREVVSNGNLSQLLRILARSPKFHEDRKSYLSRADLRGTTLLMSACSSGKADVVEFLLANGACVQARDHRQRTALHLAASNNSLDVVKLLLGAEAWMYDEDDNGLMALHYASQNGRKETAHFLIENGCDVNRSTSPTSHNTHGSGRQFIRATALHFAAQNGRNETVVLLLQKGAEINSVTSDGQTPLMLASEGGHVTTVQLLIREEADINASDSCRNTALEYAVLKERLPVVRLLIEAGICLKNFVGSAFCERLLYTTAIKRRDRGLLESLIEAQDKIRDILQELRLSQWNKTLMHVAAETKDNVQVVDLLIVIFGDVNVRTSRGQTPLHFAADVDIARRLVEAGATVNVTDQFGESPAMAAARNNRWEIVEFLIQERSFITSMPNKFGQTLQNMATIWQAPDSVSRLLEIKS